MANEEEIRALYRQVLDEGQGNGDTVRMEQLDLACDGDPEFALELVDIFRDSVASEIAGLETSLNGRDTQTLKRQAHTVKGASRNLGLERVAQVAAKLEVLAKDGHLEDAAEIIRNLDAEVSLAIEFLEGYASSLQKAA